MNSRIKAAQAKLADPGLFTRDPSGFAKLAAALEAMTHELGEAETRWLELEMQREGLE